MQASSNRSFVPMVGDPRVRGRGWGGRHAGGAFPAHGVYSTYAVEEGRETGVLGCEQEGRTDEVTVFGPKSTEWTAFLWVQTDAV